MVEINRCRHQIHFDASCTSSDGEMLISNVILMQLFERVSKKSTNIYNTELGEHLFECGLELIHVQMDDIYASRLPVTITTPSTPKEITQVMIQSTAIDITTSAGPTRNSQSTIQTTLFVACHSVLRLGFVVTMRSLCTIRRSIQELENLMLIGGNMEEETLHELTRSYELEEMLYTIVMEPDVVHIVVDFMERSANWLLPLIQCHPHRLSVIPYHFIQDIVDIMEFIGQNCTILLPDRTRARHLWELCLELLCTNVIRVAPHTRSSLVIVWDALVHRSVTCTSRRDSFLYTMDATVHVRLLTSMVRLYVNNVPGTSCTTGLLRMRHHIANVLVILCKDPVYQGVLTEVVIHPDTVQFYRDLLNQLIDDMSVLFDEGMRLLRKLCRIQKQMRTYALTGTTYVAETFVSPWLIRETSAVLDMLHGSTRLLCMMSGFGKCDVVDNGTMCRIANSTSYFIHSLTDVRNVEEINVSNKSRVRLKPSTLLRDMVVVILNFSHNADFLRAIAENDRSYHPNAFTNVMQICHDLQMFPPTYAQQIDTVWSQINVYWHEVQHFQSMILSVAPDRFLDPITAMLMRDPVILPISRVIIDRTTIERHILSKSVDPFTQTALDINDVVNDIPLGIEIRDFLEKHRVNKNP
jgi:ubiquitin conjugation factor E4 B